MGCRKCGANDTLPKRRVCRKCQNAYQREWNGRNRDKSRMWARDYYCRNRQAILDKMFIRYWSDADFRKKCIERCRQRRHLHPQQERRASGITYCDLVEDITPDDDTGGEIIDMRLSLPPQQRQVLDALIECNFDVGEVTRKLGGERVEKAMESMRELYEGEFR